MLVVADRQHIHIVVAAASGISGEVFVLLDDVVDAAPYRTDVSGNAPRIRHLARPGAGETPAAEIEFHRLFYHGVHHLTYARVAFLGRKGDFTVATEINFDELEAQFVEEHLAVLRVVAIESYTEPVGVVVVPGAAGARTRIRIDAGFKPQGMDVLHRSLQPVGETGGMGNQASGAVTIAEIAVVDIDKVVAGIFQAHRDHQVGLLHNDAV